MDNLNRGKPNTVKLHRPRHTRRGLFFFGSAVKSFRPGVLGIDAKQRSGSMSEQKKVAVIMGSDSDFPVVSAAVKKLKSFGIPVETHVISAHRTPQKAAEFASTAEENGFGVIIAAAGMAAHLAGVLAAYTTLPVIGIPMKSAALEGLDALLATVQMPSGIPVATVAVGGAENAAILAAEMLALSDSTIAAKLKEMKQQMKEKVAAKDKAIQEEAAKL
jgi:5-(carboxyamino)imidazole ribonucleotide mutase